MTEARSCFKWNFPTGSLKRRRNACPAIYNP
jgi:hypothetical protein